MKKRPVILHCLGWVTRGGVEQRRLLLADHPNSRRFSHVLICQVATPPLSLRIEREGWIIHEIGIARGALDLRWYLRAYQIARDLQPTVIHGAVFEGNLLATFLGLLIGNAKVIIEETSDFRGRRFGGNFLFALMARRADSIVGVAPQVSRELKTRVGKNSHKVRDITNGTRLHRPLSLNCKLQLREKYSIGESDLVLGSSGRLDDDHKRFSDVIRVVASLSQEVTNLKLLIVGDGDDRDFLRSLSAELEIEDRVIFVGFQDNPRDFLELVDVFVLASSGEALPMALIEAMHAGLACIATRVGGNPYILDHGRAGVLFSAGDLDHFRRSALELLRSRRTREIYGNLARSRAATHFGVDRYVGDVLDLWDDILGTT